MSAQAEDDKAPLVLEPASPWHVNYADDSCRLARTFGKEDDESIFYIERHEPGDRFFMLVAGSPFERSREGKVDFAFGPGGRESENAGRLGTFGKYEPAIILDNMALLPLSHDKESYDARKIVNSEEATADTNLFEQELTPEQEATIEWLEVRRNRGRPVRLALGSMGDSMKAMRTCTDELLTHWGIDVEEHRKLTKAVVPKGNAGRWMTSSDYPVGLLDRGTEGIVKFRLSVDVDGNPTACQTLKSTRPVGFDDVVCQKLMRRAQFEPALGENGQPIASFWRSAVRFAMP